MSKLDSRKLIKAQDVLLQDLNGEAVLLNLKNGQYYGLDENSFHMYQVLISSQSTNAAYEELLRGYDIDSEQLKTDLEKFLYDLIENGLVTYSNDQLE